MRIPVPRGVVFAAALVAVVIPVSRCAYTWFRDISADKHIIYGHSEHPESSAHPQVLPAEANRFYWLNNGPRAAPLYAKAESLFASRGDTRNELYAKLGRLRSEAETMSFVDLSRFLNDQLQNAIMRSVAPLLLRRPGNRADGGSGTNSTTPANRCTGPARRVTITPTALSVCQLRFWREPVLFVSKGYCQSQNLALRLLRDGSDKLSRCNGPNG